MSLGTHIFKNPAGTYSFVGTLPLSLAKIVKPTKADIMGQRYFTDKNGNIKGYKFPVFITEAEGRQYAADRGVELVK